MTTCLYCNGEVPEGAKFCTNCGAALPVEAPVEQPTFETPVQQSYQQPEPPQQYQQQTQQQFQQPYQQPYQQAAVEDKGSIGWAILGFIIPIVGIVLYFVWRTSKPKSANMAIMGAVISIVLALIFQFAGI